MKKLILFVLAVVSLAYGQTTTFIPMGGINDQTANYLVVATDVGKIVRMNCASCTVTLPSVPPYLRWSVFISNINSSALTVSPNGVSLDGSTSSLSLAQNQSVWISTDGTVYGTVRGGGAGTTTAADQSILFSQIGTVSGDGLLTYDYINKVIGWPAPFVATTSWPGTPLSPPGTGKTRFGVDSDGIFRVCVENATCLAPGSASFPDGTTLAPGLPATLHPELGLAIVLSKIAYPITNVARATNVVTITVSTPNVGLNWPVNGTISTFGLLTPYDVLNCARCTLLSVTGGTPTSTFTYTLAGADVGSAAATGSSSIYETQLTGYSVALTRLDTTSNNPAQRGSIRGSHTDAHEWRNAANTDDCIGMVMVGGVDEFQVGGQCAGYLGLFAPGYLRMTEQAAPANPAASNAKLYVDSTSHNLTCLNSSGGSCLPAGGSSAFSAITGSTNTGAAMVLGASGSTGASISPNAATSGQVAATQTWYPAALPPLVLTANNSGGSITTGHGINVVYTLVSGLGETDISQVTTAVTPTCTIAGTCSVTVTAPTIPTGYSGYTVYDYDNNGGGPPYKKQAASGACVNITTNCTIQVVGAGAGVPTVNTAIVQPPNVQADVCAPGVRNAMYAQAADGNYYVQAGNDTTNTGATPPAPYSAFTFCRRTWFNDTGVDPPGFKNSFVLINHQAGIGTNAAVQDRALGILYATPANDNATRWGIEGIQAEVDNNCNGCNFNGSPDGEVTVFSGQMSDSAVTSYTPGTYGPSVARLQYFKSGAGQSSGNVMTVVNGIFTLNNSAAVTNGTEARIYEANCANPTATLNMDCVALHLDPPGIRFGNGFGALIIENTGAAIGGADPNSQDYVIKNYKHGLVSWLNGPLGLTEISNTDPGALPIDASLNVTGSVTTTPIATSWATGYSNPTCSGGASQYTYQFVAVDNNGGTAPSVASNTSASCTNPLTSGNPVTISTSSSTTATLALRRAIRIDVYRTGGPMGTGKIGSITCNNNIPISSCGTFTDTGLAASGAVPTTNTFGMITSAGIIHSGANTVQAAADFTSAGNTSLQTITGLTWNLDSSAHNYSFHCSLIYSQATAAVAMQFGIQAATNNPTQINARGRVDTSTSAATSGVLTGLATTTATSIVTFTPSATATLFGAELDGTIENPANTNGNIVNIMVQTSNASDLPTVKRGSYCTLY